MDHMHFVVSANLVRVVSWYVPKLSLFSILNTVCITKHALVVNSSLVQVRQSNLSRLERQSGSQYRLLRILWRKTVDRSARASVVKQIRATCLWCLYDTCAILCMDARLKVVVVECVVDENHNRSDCISMETVSSRRINFSLHKWRAANVIRPPWKLD